MLKHDQHAIKLPDGWNKVCKIGSGGQALAVHIRHEDGRDGVFRRIKRPMSPVNKGRFHRELEILSQNAEHRGIVTLWDWSSEGEHPWYISELGDSFQEWWKRRKQELKDTPKSLVDEAIQTIRQVTSTLAVCHDNGIVHRDLKPKNLIMKRDVANPWPILIDFGIAYNESSDRLTPLNDAVGSARFSPDIMTRRTENVPPWLDVFCLGQLLIWMLDEEGPKEHWQRPVAWNYAVYNPMITETMEQLIRAFTAACSNRTSGPTNGQEALNLLETLFPVNLKSLAERVDIRAIVEAKRRGSAKKLLIEAALNEEIELSAPLAKIAYGQLRQAVLDVLQEVSSYDPTAIVVYDRPFDYRLIGATDLLRVSIGPTDTNIQLRIKAKIVTQNATPTTNESNRAFWRKYIPDDSICFTFALEGGIPQAGNTVYTDCRWVTVRRDGTMYLHQLDGDLGTNYANNDLGGSAKGPGTICLMEDIRKYIASVFTNSLFWEFITAR